MLSSERVLLTGPSQAVGTGHQDEVALVLALPGSPGWAVVVALCSLEGGFGLWLRCMLLGSLLSSLPRVGLGGFSFCSALSCLAKGQHLSAVLSQVVYPKLKIEDAPQSSKMLLVALTSASWHLGTGQCLFSPGVTDLHQCVLLPSVPGWLGESRRYARLLRCA